MSKLDAVDLSRSLSRTEEQRGLENAWARLAQLRLTLGGQIGEKRIGPPVLVLLEGWDASGKGGAIKRLVAPMDPRHVRVVQFAAPTPDEKRHHFLWRFWRWLPGWGGLAIFDRTWYGHGAKSNWIIAFGIVVILAAIGLLQVAIATHDGRAPTGF